MPASKKKRTRAHLFGIPIDNVDAESIRTLVGRHAEKPQAQQIVLLSWWGLVKAITRWEYRTIVQKAVLVVPTSYLLTLGVRITRQAAINITTSFEFAVKLLAALENNKLSLALLGMEVDDIVRVEENIRNTYPELRVLGRFSGYFDAKQEQAILTAVRKASPDCLFIGHGLIDNEGWPYRIKHNINPAILFWSSEAMGVLAKKRNRPPSSRTKRMFAIIGTYIRKPWRLYRFPVFLVYFFTLAGKRIFARK